MSAVDALAAAPICRDLGTVALARLVPELEERQFAPGQTVYAQGDPADGLYLVRSGTAEVSVRTPSGGQEVSVLGPAACFGDVELLTDESRIADIVARTPLTVWKLPRERFEALVGGQAELSRRVAAGLADRLTERTRTLTESREQLSEAARATYWALDARTQAVARRAALFETFDDDLVREVAGDAWSVDAYSRLSAEPSLVTSTDERWLCFATPSVRDFLLEQLLAEVGQQDVIAWCRRAADAYLSRGDAVPEIALGLLRCAEDWPRLAKHLEAHGGEAVKRAPQEVEAQLCALPSQTLWSSPALIGLLAECRVSQGRLEDAADAFLTAQRENPELERGPVGAAFQHELAELYRRLGDDERLQECLLRLRDIGEIDVATVVHGNLPVSHNNVGVAPASAPWHARALVVVQAVCTDALTSWRWIGTIAVLALTGASWLLPPPAGLPDAAFRVLATLAALVALSFLGVLPDYLLGLLLIATWVVTGALPANVAAAGFASPTWFLMLASMAVGIAVERSGLLYRGAIGLVRRLPSNHVTRCLALAGLGFFSALAMPSAPGRVLLAMPVAQDISDALRQPPGSRGAIGLALATFVGFGLFGSLFLTGNPMGLIVYGLLPPETQAEIGWSRWFVAALPTHLILFAVTVGFVIWRYRPDRDTAPPGETLMVQLRVLGPVRKTEGIVATVLLLLVIGFATQSLHGVNPAWIAVAAMAVLFVARVLDDAAFQNGVNLSFLLYVGVILGFGDIFAHLQLDQWLAGTLAGVPAIAQGSQTLFILVVALVTMLLSVALRSGPIGLLVALALFGPAMSLGVNPWVVAMTVLLSMNLWMYPQQNMLYQTAYLAGGERSFTHADARPLALLYPAFVLLALIASVPYWRMLGLL